MRVTLFLEKSLEENAALYFEKAKTAKKKLQGAKEARERTLKLLQRDTLVTERPKEPAKRRQEWYERFRWFFSSENILCIGGRDASTNEQVVRKHALAGETVLHCELAGSPFFVVKSLQPSASTIQEAAIATGSYSKAWKLGIGNVEVYAVKREQLSKEAPSGEFMGKGAFMVRGRRERFTVIPRLAIALADGKVICGPRSAIAAKAERIIEIQPGTTKASDTAKLIARALGGGSLDDIIRALPPGGCKALL